MAEKDSAKPQLARLVLEGSAAAAAAHPARPASVRTGAGSAATSQPAVDVMGRGIPRVLLRPPGKRTPIRERRRPGSSCRDGFQEWSKSWLCSSSSLSSSSAT